MNGTIMIRTILPLCLVACLLLGGCTETGQSPPPLLHDVTTLVTPVSPLPAPLPKTTPAMTTVTEPPTPAAVTSAVTFIPVTPEPADVSEIQFVRYSDNDFSMDYPAAWNVSRTTHSPYICIPTETFRCYRKEIATIGPFNFSEMPALKTPSRIITFTSADGRLKAVAFISDFRDSLVGYYEINPDIGWARSRVHSIFPDVNGFAAVSDYRYDRSAHAMTFSYTVILPELSEDYPLAYASENFVTVHRDYEFVFVTDNEDFRKYRELRERIFSSITPNDIV